ncbi:hypothetical protein [Streptomyces sp. NPDC048644]|uniref:hypothetical protein n=1 Tax=Streptomyces sp. NPDC048644 TaxID=3365582 RepID=UPI00371A8312
MRKPKVAVAPAVTQILAPLLDARAARKLYEAHTKGCVACAPSSRTRRCCTDGGRIAHLVAHKQRTEPARRAALTVREDLAEQRERGLSILREALIRARTGAPTAYYETWDQHPARTVTDVLTLLAAAAAFARHYGPAGTPPPSEFTAATARLELPS